MYTLHTTELSFSSTDSLHIRKIGFHSNLLTFHWKRTATDCSTVHYNINSSNCGSCPTATNRTSVTCTNIPTNGGECVFAVSTVVCENIIKNQSGKINVTLDSKMTRKGIILHYKNNSCMVS